MHIPAQRGPVSSSLLAILAGQPDGNAAALAELQTLVCAQVAATGDIIEDEDLQLALFCLYELHYGGLDGVDDGWEWNPGLIAARRLLELPFEEALRAASRTEAPEVPPVASEGPVSDAVATALFALAAADAGPSLA
jgi:hypothetical protein